MIIKQLPDLLIALATLITAVGTLRNHTSLKSVKAEVSHNHGSSMKDAIERIEKRQSSLVTSSDHLTNEVKMLGHQIGEIRKDASIAHEDYASRLRALEQKA